MSSSSFLYDWENVSNVIKNIFKKKIKSARVIYKLWTTYPNHPLIFEKVILDVFYSAPNLLIDKPMVISLRQTDYQLNNDT